MHILLVNVRGIHEPVHHAVDCAGIERTALPRAEHTIVVTGRSGLQPLPQVTRHSVRHRQQARLITAGYAVVYDATPAADADKALLTLIDFEGEEVSEDGDFVIDWDDTNGIFQVDTNPA